jgi:hypothetical protein
MGWQIAGIEQRVEYFAGRCKKLFSVAKKLAALHEPRMAPIARMDGRIKGRTRVR